MPAFELHRRQKRRQGRADLKIGCRLSASDLSASSSSSGRSAHSRGSSGLKARCHPDLAIDDGADESAMELGLDDSLGEGSSSFPVQDFAFMPIVTPIGSVLPQPTRVLGPHVADFHHCFHRVADRSTCGVGIAAASTSRLRRSKRSSARASSMRTSSVRRCASIAPAPE